MTEPIFINCYGDTIKVDAISLRTIKLTLVKSSVNDEVTGNEITSVQAWEFYLNQESASDLVCAVSRFIKEKSK